MSNELTQDQLKNYLTYHSESGLFCRVGSDVSLGCINKKGYVKIRVLDRTYMAHRLAWLYTNGSMPKDQIDHINHDKADNKIINLREVSNQENLKNQGMRGNNTSGFIGVYWDNKQEKWSSQVMVDAKCIFLGRFKNKQDAIKARKKANIKYGFHKNHGEKTNVDKVGD